MRIQLTYPSSKKISASVQITGSKSETNRLLLLQKLFPNLSLTNLSNSDDAQVMQKGLAIDQGIVDIFHAGTAMRFLTSFFATQTGKSVELTGSPRMKQRPIKVLVDALTDLGADIRYVENDGYPPLAINGVKIVKQQVSLPANISSQYISSLCLVAPSLENGLEIELIGKVTSVPYINMTLGLLAEIGVTADFDGQTIRIQPKSEVADTTMVVESDWSAASYYYSIAALSEVGSTIELASYKDRSLQGDRVLAEVYAAMGGVTDFFENHIVLTKTEAPKTAHLVLDLANAPDIAQTVAVTCYGLGMTCHLSGLHTLPIKETDRLAAMKTELEKFGATVVIDSQSLHLKATTLHSDPVAVDTYHDHRMAMAFAPLAMKRAFQVNEAEVVSKSYPDFWNDLAGIGFSVKEA